MKLQALLYPRLNGVLKLCSIGAAGAGLVIFSAAALGKTAACPCNPCPCSPCTCGGGGKSPPSGGGKTKTSDSSKTSDGSKAVSKHHEGTADKGHHGDRGHGRDHGHAGGVGVSVYVPDGIGQRKREDDPFASSPEQPIAHTREKPDRPKTKEREVTKTNEFDKVQLTGTEAKGDFKQASNP